MADFGQEIFFLGVAAWPYVLVTLLEAGFSADLSVKTTSGALSTDVAEWLDVAITLACLGWEPVVPDLATCLALAELSGLKTL